MTADGERALRRRLVAAFDWTFRDRGTGRVTIGQFPNPALAIFLATVALGQVTDDDTVVGMAVAWTGTVALGWWAVAEVRSGVNPWRRLLGLVGCAAVVARIASLLG